MEQDDPYFGHGAMITRIPRWATPEDRVACSIARLTVELKDKMRAEDNSMLELQIGIALRVPILRGERVRTTWPY